MNNINQKNSCIHLLPRPSLPKQRGMMTILMMLIIGIAMSALSIGMIHNVKSTQHKQAAVHASSHAQPMAWAGAETFRHYLAELNADQLEALRADTKVGIKLSSMDDDTAEIYAIVQNTPSKSTDGEYEYYDVIANISAFAKKAQASQTLKAVYRVAPVGGKNCFDCDKLEVTIDFHDDLDLSGSVRVDGSLSQPATFNVDGDVNATTISLDAINYLNSTGDVTISAGVFIDEIYANGTITIGGSAGVTKASSLNGIVMEENTNAEQLFSNGDITLSGIARSDTTIQTLGTLYNRSVANQGNTTAGVDILTTAMGGSMQSANAVNNIDIAYSSHHVGAINAQGDVACPNPSWTRYDSIRAGGNTINCPNTNAVEGTTVGIDLMQPLTPFELPRPRIDVNAYKDYANYVFTAEGDAVRVFVRNISGVDDGNYYVADYPSISTRGYRDFLCKEIDDGGECINPASPNDTHTICYSHTVWDECLTYDADADEFVFNGKSFAPGVMWFEGNLSLGNGSYYNTFLATGDVRTEASMHSEAPNFAGYNTICELDYPKQKNTSGDFDALFPTSLCDKDKGELKYNAVANIAIGAGSYDDDGNFSGGTINVEASNDIGGSILAGDYLITHGSTTIRGYVSAAAQGDGTGENKIGGATTININDLPDTYNPGQIPPGELEPPGDGGSTGKGISKLVWAKHL